MQAEYSLIEVFTNRRFGGNQLAVFTDGESIPPRLMPIIARELNLSETTFVLPPTDPANNYRVRIFTPGGELPMAGHPTVGTAYVLARKGMLGATPEMGTANIVFEEGVGPIPVEIEFERGAPTFMTMTQPLPEFGEIISDLSWVAEMISLEKEDILENAPCQVVSCGVPFLFVPLRDLSAARRARPRLDMFERLREEMGMGEVFVFTSEVENAGSTVHSRMFAPGFGILEDPATGGASGPLGSYLVRYGLVPPAPVSQIVSEQGIELGRPSIINIEIKQEEGEITEVKVGGECVFMGGGRLELGEG